MFVLTANVPAKFTTNFKNGIHQTDALQVFRTTIMIGNGNPILEFAKDAIVSALEPETPEAPFILWTYSRVKRSPPKQQKGEKTTRLRVA